MRPFDCCGAELDLIRVARPQLPVRPESAVGLKINWNHAQGTVTRVVTSRSLDGLASGLSMFGRWPARSAPRSA